MQTIDPPPAAIIPGSTARVIRNIERTLTACSQSHSATVVSRNGLMTMVPAWLKSTRAGPNSSSTARTASCTCASSETSATKLSALPPAARIPATVSAAAAALRSMIATLAPSAANSRDAAPPMPVAPPEMIASFPSSLPIVSYLPAKRSAPSRPPPAPHRPRRRRPAARRS